MHGDLRFASPLNRMHQSVAGLISWDRCVGAFIQALVAVRNVARGATHAAIIASFLTSFHGMMAALTFLADVGEGRQGGIGPQAIQFVDSQRLRQWFMTLHEDVGLLFRQQLHVLAIRRGS